MDQPPPQPPPPRRPAVAWLSPEHDKVIKLIKSIKLKYYYLLLLQPPATGSDSTRLRAGREEVKIFRNFENILVKIRNICRVRGVDQVKLSEIISVWNCSAQTNPELSVGQLETWGGGVGGYFARPEVRPDHRHSLRLHHHQGAAGRDRARVYLSLSHNEPAKGKNAPNRGFGCLELVLYGIRELV